MGIPDLRLEADPYISLEADRAKARKLAEVFDDHDFAGLVSYYYRNTPAVPSHHAAQYTRGLLAATQRSARQLSAWRKTVTMPPAQRLRVLDLGCGTAPFLVAASRLTQASVGIDIAFRWLLMARKRLTEHGLCTPLVCGSGTALPFGTSTFDVVTAESVLEHVRDGQPKLLAEVRRALEPGGQFWFTTPNRWSIGPDPHTGLPGGSWLPDWAVAAFVHRTGGIPPHRRLLSHRELQQQLSGTGFELEALDLPVMHHLSSSEPAWLRLVAATYDRARTLPGIRRLLYQLGPGWCGRARPVHDDPTTKS